MKKKEYIMDVNLMESIKDSINITFSHLQKNYNTFAVQLDDYYNKEHPIDYDFTMVEHLESFVLTMDRILQLQRINNRTMMNKFQFPVAWTNDLATYNEADLGDIC